MTDSTSTKPHNCTKCHNPLTRETFRHQLTWVQNKGRPAYLYDGGRLEKMALDEWPDVEQISVKHHFTNHEEEKTRFNTFFVRKDNAEVRTQIETWTRKRNTTLLGEILGYLQPNGIQEDFHPQGTPEVPLTRIRYFLNWMVGSRCLFSERYVPPFLPSSQMEEKLILLQKTLPHEKVSLEFSETHTTSYEVTTKVLS